MTDSPIEQQLRKDIIDLIWPEFAKELAYEELNGLSMHMINEIMSRIDAYATRRAGLGASEKPAPQEEVGGKQVDTSHPEKED